MASLRWLSIWVFFLKKLLFSPAPWSGTIPGSLATVPQLGSLLGDRRVGAGTITCGG